MPKLNLITQNNDGRRQTKDSSQEDVLFDATTGNAVKILRNAVAPFAVGEDGLWIDPAGVLQHYEDGVGSSPVGGGGAIPDATSGPGGAVKGLVTLDSNEGLEAIGGVAKIKNLGVTTAKIANNAVDSNQLANSSVQTSKIHDNALNNDHLAVYSGKVNIVNGAITNTLIQNNAITDVKILNNTISNGKLLDGAKYLQTNNTFEMENTRLLRYNASTTIAADNDLITKKYGEDNLNRQFDYIVDEQLHEHGITAAVVWSSWNGVGASEALIQLNFAAGGTVNGARLDVALPGDPAFYYLHSSDTVDYYFWFNVTDGVASVDPNVAGRTGVQVDVLLTDTSYQAIQTKLTNAITANCPDLQFNVPVNNILEIGQLVVGPPNNPANNGTMPSGFLNYQSSGTLQQLFLDNGTTTETYTARWTATGPFEFSVITEDALNSLMNTINTDSAYFNMKYVLDLERYNWTFAPYIIYETGIPSPGGPSPSTLWSTIQNNQQFLTSAAYSDYSQWDSHMNPTSGNKVSFGPRKHHADIKQNDLITGQQSGAVLVADKNFRVQAGQNWTHNPVSPQNASTYDFIASPSDVKTLVNAIRGQDKRKYKRIYIPAGEYDFTSAYNGDIFPHQGIELIQGAGSQSTKLIFNRSAGTMLLLYNNSTNVDQSMKLSGFTIDNQHVAPVDPWIFRIEVGGTNDRSIWFDDIKVIGAVNRFFWDDNIGRAHKITNCSVILTTPSSNNQYYGCRAMNAGIDNFLLDFSAAQSTARLDAIDYSKYINNVKIYMPSGPGRGLYQCAHISNVEIIKDHPEQTTNGDTEGLYLCYYVSNVYVNFDFNKNSGATNNLIIPVRDCYYVSCAQAIIQSPTGSHSDTPIGGTPFVVPFAGGGWLSSFEGKLLLSNASNTFGGTSNISYISAGKITVNNNTQYAAHDTYFVSSTSFNGSNTFSGSNFDASTQNSTNVPF